MKALRKCKPLALLLAFGMAVSPIRTFADDIDIFVGTSGGTATAPNVLIILDNTSNWASANQHWPGGIFQGQAELQAIKAVIGDASIDDTINIGLMMMTNNEGTSRPGGYIRFNVQPMNATNKAAFQTKLQSIYDNFGSTVEKTPSSHDYSTPLFDAWKYFGGFASVPGDTGGTPKNATHFGPDVFDQKQNGSNGYDTLADVNGYTSSSLTTFRSPIGAGTGCGKNYIIFIGNGFPPKETTNSTTDAACSAGNPDTNACLVNVGGNTTEIPLPNFTTTTTTSSTVVGMSSACYAKQSSGQTACTTANASACGSAYDSCTCGTPTDSSACSGQNVKYSIIGTKSTTTVTATNTYSAPTGNATNHKADEWTRFLYQADASSESSQQNITTYTIDVFNDAQNADQTALLLSMARVGGGKYFPAKNLSQIVTALKTIFAEIQAVNSTFASASLPISATNRSLNDNEVYIGMFRPDSDARPRWFGNLKRYQLIRANGQIELGDAGGVAATDNNTGFVTGCAVSFWTSDSGTYWADDPINPPPINQCTTSTTDKFSDAPDGSHVEKGSVAEVIRKGNNPPTTNTTPTWAINRTLKTLSGTALVDFTAASSGLSTALYDFTRGVDVDDERANADITETRPSLHGDVVHSRSLPINQGVSLGTTLYYGSNDGTFRAVNAANGKERWGFIAPEFFTRTAGNVTGGMNVFDRLRQNSPIISFATLPSGVTPTPQPKDYFFDGSIGFYQNADASQVWIYPSQRRGGRMIYAFDVSNPDAPSFKWRAGCPNLFDDTGCTTNGILMDAIGQTWSTPNAAFILGHSSGSSPVVAFGGGYDGCEDTNASSLSCGSEKGRKVYILNGDTGTVLASFATDRSVTADVALVDIDYDGKMDYAYAVDLGGNIYRIDFIDGPVSRNPLPPASWTMHKVAFTSGSGRKFHHMPAVLPISGKVYVAVGSGDREKPLSVHYPYVDPVANRFYVYLDDLADAATVTDLDDTTTQEDFTLPTTCDTPGIVPASTKKGWFMALAGRGEQAVTSAVIAGGAVAFSTNRALPAVSGSCASTLGEARGYLMNVTNASGVIGTNALCTPASGSGSTAGRRSSVFVGGGLPPSPVIATVNIGGVVDTVGIGIVDPSGLGPEIPIRPRPITVPLNLKRRPVYWFSSGKQ